MYLQEGLFHHALQMEGVRVLVITREDLTLTQTRCDAQLNHHPSCILQASALAP